MKICILTHDEDTSAGWGRYSNQVIRGLQSRGHNVVVLTERGGAHPFLRRRLGILLSALRAISFFRTCDIVHALDVYPYGVIAWLANIATRKPLILSGVGTYSVAPLRRGWLSWFARRACRKAEAILAISSYTADRMRELVPDARIHVVNLGIEGGANATAQAHHAHAVISVGALKERKGYHIALEAFALARKSIPDLRYVIIGDQRDSGYFERLKSIIARLGITDAVSFKQQLTEGQLRNEYRSAGLFLLPSVNVGDHFEGFGLVFLEAASMGLPVIGTTGNGISDAVGPDNGILVPQNDIGATAEAIEQTLSNPERWHTMSAAGISWAAAHAVGSMIDAYERVYSESV